MEEKIREEIEYCKSLIKQLKKEREKVDTIYTDGRLLGQIFALQGQVERLQKIVGEGK